MEPTDDFILSQTMLRIRDPRASLEFYTAILGMSLLSQFDFPEMHFSLYFVGYLRPEDGPIPDDAYERARLTFRHRGAIELTYNHHTNDDTSDPVYHNGNSEPRGFGHIGITVPDVNTACARFEALGVKFIKHPTQGKMKGLAFIQDPDGYWIEILSADSLSRMLTSSDNTTQVIST